LKYHLGGAFQEYAFKDAERAELLRVLPERSARDRAAAQLFVEAARIEVRHFLFDVPLYSTSEKQHKEKLESLAKAARALHAALDAIPADTGASLHAEIFTTLWCDPYKFHHMRIGKQLTKLGLTSFCNDDFLEGLLDVLEQAATRLAGTHKVRTKAKPENKIMLGLTAKLVRHYRTFFQKEPTAGNGSNFRKFMGELSRITGYEFGAETVKEAIELVEKVSKDFAPISEKQQNRLD
jgi:hypothetical protein